jgi:feruloyl esterase
MIMRQIACTACVVGTFLLLAPAGREFQPELMAAGASCESLSGLALTNAHVTSATMVAAGGFVPPGGPGPGNAAQQYAALPAFCRVAVTSNPVSDSDIKIEVWLPAAGWNGRFQGTGNGGWGGTITYTALAVAIGQGYAAASSDVGHSTPGGSFAMNHPEKLRDYAYRGAHEMTVQAKAVINAFYGTPQKTSIFSGCSTGGRMGIVEASKYPEDYDAYVTGATSLTFPRIHGARVQFIRQG